MTTPTTKHQSIAVDELTAFRAEYKGQTVRLDPDSVRDGKVNVSGHFGFSWTHGGWAEEMTKTVLIQDLNDLHGLDKDGGKHYPLVAT